MSIEIPETLRKHLEVQPGGADWLRKLPGIVAALRTSWALELSNPYQEDLTGSWVAPCTSSHGASVLKVGFPHFEADYEIDGLQAWAGGCTVRLFNFDKSANALLLERCDPGTTLRQELPTTQDQVIVEMLRELWQTPPPTHIRSLEEMITNWRTSAEKRYAEKSTSADEKLVHSGLSLLAQLAGDRCTKTLLATDLHAGNILRSGRRPWLVIDPKPHVGDPCYDLSQHVMNILPRIETEGVGLIERLARAADVNAERALGWVFGRLCLDRENLRYAQIVQAFL